MLGLARLGQHPGARPASLYILFSGMTMTAPDRKTHWQQVYLNKGEQEVSWTQARPEPSLSLIEKFAPSRQASIVDIGGGASRLVDALCECGYRAVVLDLSEAALRNAEQR